MFSQRRSARGLARLVQDEVEKLLPRQALRRRILDPGIPDRPARHLPEAVELFVGVADLDQPLLPEQRKILRVGLARALLQRLVGARLGLEESLLPFRWTPRDSAPVPDHAAAAPGAGCHGAGVPGGDPVPLVAYMPKG